MNSIKYIAIGITVSNYYEYTIGAVYVMSKVVKGVYHVTDLIQTVGRCKCRVCEYNIEHKLQLTH